MKRKIWLASAALLAVAALEFGLLGARSAGASFVPSWLSLHREAPSPERQSPCPPPGNSCKPAPAPTPVSPPPCLPDRQHADDRACDQQPASIQLTPDPLAIHCNGVERGTLTVRITDAQGRPVPDGTMAYFGAYNGTTSPYAAQTRRGVASTSVVFYSDIFRSGPNLIVDVGLIEAGVRIRCFPASDQQPPGPPPCPLSPPQASPPCAPPPPPPTPPPCWPQSPPVSPPCGPPPAPVATATPAPEP